MTLSEAKILAGYILSAIFILGAVAGSAFTNNIIVLIFYGLIAIFGVFIFGGCLWLVWMFVSLVLEFVFGDGQ